LPPEQYEYRGIRLPTDTTVRHEFHSPDTVNFYGVGHGENYGLDAPLGRLRFQSGPIPECGVNGVTNEVLIEAARERITRQNDALPCNENEEAMYHLTYALAWLNMRTERRKLEGVEGKHEEMGG